MSVLAWEEYFFQEKVCFNDQSSHRDTWSHSKMTLLAWITFTLGELGVPVDQREDCLDHLGNHLPPYITIQLHRHYIFKRGLIAVFKELFRILSSSDLQSPWVIPREPTTSSFSNSPGNWFIPSKVDNHFTFICWKLSLNFIILYLVDCFANIILKTDEIDISMFASNIPYIKTFLVSYPQKYRPMSVGG